MPTLEAFTRDELFGLLCRSKREQPDAVAACHVVLGNALTIFLAALPHDASHLYLFCGYEVGWYKLTAESLLDDDDDDHVSASLLTHAIVAVERIPVEDERLVVA